MGMRPITDADRTDVLSLTHAMVREGWCQNGDAVDEQGRPVDDTAPEAARWCVQGALYVAFLERSAALGIESWENLRLWSDLYGLLTDVAGRNCVAYNDAPRRRKRDVLRLIERTAARIGK
jgi:hypothetical protein